MAGRPELGRGNGVVFPSPVVILSILAVVMAAVAFVATRGATPDEREIATPVRQDTSASASPTTEPTTPEATKKPKPAIKRSKVFVEVYNNSGITGLAGVVGGQATAVGWQVVGTDNWYGNIPTNTVYYPDRLKRAAKQLALDLGIQRTAGADGAMKLDRLTVILTSEL
ncbi:LytR C-terminal domain-containing protein [Nocardioides sp.]|uniref:LytR C-terminal domain-containing protein n=1 Tax=Nocardioides sp. TaxID=35761 RepID=UPI002B273B35|nr:LytR C-terminal domain-containing protein [Nocardioides sp.]